MRLIVITFTLLVALARFSHGAPLTIVENGNARAAIVVAQNEDHARRAGAAVQSYIEKMSGARLPIVTEGEDAGQPISIYLGHTGAAAAPHCAGGCRWVAHRVRAHNGNSTRRKGLRRGLPPTSAARQCYRRGV